MDENEALRPTTPGETAEIRRWGSDEPILVVPGHEFDVRPDPGGVHAADQTQILRVPSVLGTSPVSPPTPASLWPDANTTGAFVSRAASLRHEVAPRRWWDVAWWMVMLWVVVVGLPLAGAVWAALVIWGRVRHG